MLVLVDTNLLLRFTETHHSQHVLAVSSMQVLRQAGHELCVVPQNHYEFWVVATRSVTLNGLGLSISEAEKQLRRHSSSLFRVLRDERAIYGHWRELVSKYSIQGKNAHDARLVAAMMRHDVKHLLTFNVADFARFEEIEVLTPEQVVAKN
jgi:predicted nucleic acid-binding protein